MRNVQWTWPWLRSAILVGAVGVAVAALVLADPQGLKRLADSVSKTADLIARFVPPPVPAKTDVQQAVWLDQGWSHRDRFWFHSTVQIPTVVEMEMMLRGTDPLSNSPPAFNGLTAPKWADAAKFFPDDPAWRIDTGKERLAA